MTYVTGHCPLTVPRHSPISSTFVPQRRSPSEAVLGAALFLQLNELATRLHFAKYALRGKAVDVAKLAYRRRINSRITD
jgi:hypothetical protein